MPKRSMVKEQEKQGAEEAIVRANVERAVTLSPTFGSYYANDTQIQTSPWDLRLIFGQIMEVDPKKGRAVIMAMADVRMSPQHAKRMLAVLQGQIEQYEKLFGPIPQPEV